MPIEQKDRVSSLDLNALGRLAKDATDAVRADAVRTGTPLPVWVDGRVMLEDPVTGALSSVEDRDQLLRDKLEAVTRAKQPVNA